ncbi:hypothetical protein B0H11DRAFT_818885 [Mycena galericulata]|nr:hypothetical protein B0H11DRAFT_818885 [Mycena galericulata]
MEDPLNSIELWWRDHQEWIESCGYLLRPRFRPGWEGPTNEETVGSTVSTHSVLASAHCPDLAELDHGCNSQIRWRCRCAETHPSSCAGTQSLWRVERGIYHAAT